MHLATSADSAGNGWWSAKLVAGEFREEITGVDSLTTPDRIALLAAVSGLSTLKRRSAVELYTVSTYLAKGVVTWLPKWKSAMVGKRADGRDRIRNHDLWGQLDAVASLHDIQWHFVDPRSTHKSGIVGRTAGEGSDIGYLYCGDVPPWDASLDGYRAFTDDEKQDQNSCYQIVDDSNPPVTLEVTYRPRPETRRYSRSATPPNRASRT
jgi:ribonuclease HI